MSPLGPKPVRPVAQIAQADLFARLTSAFPKIAVLLGRQESVEGDVEKALGAFYLANGVPEIVIFVLVPELRPEREGSPESSCYTRYGLHVVCWLPASLGQSSDGLEAIGATLTALGRFLSVSKDTPLIFDGFGPVTARTGLVSYVAYFRQPMAENIRRTAAPAIAYEVTPKGILVTLSSATDGAQIWFTLNGEDPLPGREASAFFSSPFLISPSAAPLTLRAIAFTDGAQPSKTSEMDVTPIAAIPAIK